MKVSLIALCIALAASLFTGCGEKKDMNPTTETTTQATQAPTATTPAATEDNILPSTDSTPTMPSQDSSDTPSTVGPNGGVDGQNERSMGGQDFSRNGRS